MVQKTQGQGVSKNVQKRYSLDMAALTNLIYLATAVISVGVIILSIKLIKQDAQAFNDSRNCPNCLKQIPKAAKVCSYCARDVI
jgi:hypothetical protein